jgi:hypothetical protein
VKGAIPFPVTFFFLFLKMSAPMLLVVWALQIWHRGQKAAEILPEEEFRIPREKITLLLQWDYLYTLDDLAYFPEAAVRNFLSRAHPRMLGVWLETVPPEQKDLLRSLLPEGPIRGRLPEDDSHPKAGEPPGRGAASLLLSKTEQPEEPLDELLHRLIYFGELSPSFLLKERKRARAESLVFKLRDHLRSEGSEEARLAAAFIANLPGEIRGEIKALLSPKEIEHYNNRGKEEGEVSETLWGSVIQEYLGIVPDERLLNSRRGTSPTGYLTWAGDRAVREKRLDDALYLYQKALKREPEDRAVRVKLEQAELQILDDMTSGAEPREARLKLLDEHYRIRPVTLDLSSALSTLSISLKLGALKEKLARYRKSLFDELGFTFPDVHVQDLFTLAEGSYRLRLRDSPVLDGEMMTGAHMAMGAEDALRALRSEHPLKTTSGIPGVWIPADRRGKAERLGFPVMDAEEFFFFEISRVLQSRIADLFTIEDAHRVLEEFRRTHRALVDKICPAKISLGELKAVMEILLQERLPVKDPEAILYVVDEFAGLVKDPEVMAEKIRLPLGAAFAKYADHNGFLYYSAIDTYSQDIISRTLARNDLQGAHLNLDREMEKELILKVRLDREKLLQMGKEPVLLAPYEIRRALKKLLHFYYPDIVVLSHEEVRGRLKLYPLRRD